MLYSFQNLKFAYLGFGILRDNLIDKTIAVGEVIWHHLHVAVGAGAAGGPTLGHISLLLSIFVIIEDRFPSRQIIEHLRLRRVSKFKMAECLLVLEFLLRDTLASFLVLIQPPAQTAERLSTAELTTRRHAVLSGFDAFTAQNYESDG